MHKTRLEDLVAIIYRPQGLAEKIPVTYQTVLANRFKIRVRSEKEPCFGSRCRNLKDLGVLPETTKTQKLI
jgi:hypothetical protein